MQAAARSQREEQLAADVQGLRAANTALQQALSQAQAKAGNLHLEAQAQRLAQELHLVRATFVRLSKYTCCRAQRDRYPRGMGRLRMGAM